MQRWGASWSLLTYFLISSTLTYTTEQVVNPNPQKLCIAPTLASRNPAWFLTPLVGLSVWLMGRGTSICSPKTQHRW